MPPEKHAKLSASAAGRWMNCTASPTFEGKYPEQVSEYAAEGTLAHEICELKVRKNFLPKQNPRAITASINKLKKDPLYQDEMDETSDTYIRTIKEIASSKYNSVPSINAEVKLDLSEYVPEGFGTSDCVMIGDDLLTIVDYKHGKGVAVSAVDNSQMRLYALGALERYRLIYGDAIRRVLTVIVQPRISEEPSTEMLTVEELLAWGEALKPIAREAFDGPGKFVPGDHCRFCRGKAQCAARAASYTALEEFKDCVPPDQAGPDATALTDTQIGDLISRGRGLAKWLADLEDYALRSCLAGYAIPGWKAVAGRSIRTFSDQDAALNAITAAGYDEALVYDRKPKSLSELEKMMGKKEFAEVAGPYVVKPEGKPSLVPDSDKRPAISSAAADFEGVTAQC